MKIVVLVGGPSAEHEVSLSTGKNIINALNREKYLVKPVFISQQGKWHLADSFIDEASNGTRMILKASKVRDLMKPMKP